MTCWRFEVGSTVAVEGLWNRGTTGQLTQKEKLKVTYIICLLERDTVHQKRFEETGQKAS